MWAFARCLDREDYDSNVDSLGGHSPHKGLPRSLPGRRFRRVKIPVRAGQRETAPNDVGRPGRCPCVFAKIGRRRRRNGEGGIRTHGDPEATPVFKTGAFNRSATSPGDSGPLQAGAAWYRGIAELVIRRRRSTKENSPALDGASGIGLRRHSWMSPNAESASRSSRRRRRPQDAGQDAETQASQQRDDRWPPGGGGKTAGDHDAGEGAEAAGRRRGALTIAE